MTNIGESNMTLNLISEYESVIRSMQIQIEVSKEDHKNLKEEILQLISENERLNSLLEIEFKQKISENHQDESFDVFKSQLVLNLQRQLDLCQNEKNKTLELYETSLSLIEKLEQEAIQEKENVSKVTENVNSTYNANKSVLEAKLKNTKDHLEIVLNDRDQVENDNINLKTEIAKLSLNLESNCKLLEDLKVKKLELKEKYIKIQREYTLLNATHECVIQSRNELEKKLDVYSRNIQELINNNNESKNKVAEALDVAEKAIFEKDSALFREQKLQEEVNRLQLCLDHVIEEAGKKVAAEIEEAEKKCQTKLNNVLKELTDVKSEYEKIKEDSKKLSFKYKKLEKQTTSKLDKEKITLIKGSETEITILENQLDTVYKELEMVKLSHDEVTSEKKKLQGKFSELLEKHESLVREREKREITFEEMINNLKSQNEDKINELNESTKRCEYFISQVQELQEKNRNLEKIASKCHCDKLKSKMKKLNELRIAQMTELENHVESQMKLNDAWKSELKTTTEKFEERIRELKKECTELKCKNMKIMEELKQAKSKTSLKT